MDPIVMAIEAVTERQERESLKAELAEAIGRAHDRAFWAFLRRLNPWAPDFDEAFPDGKVPA